MESPLDSSLREDTLVATSSLSLGQGEALILARLYGEPLADCPDGLFIPPDALRVFLESFEGPLDLLLFLIRRQKFDVMDIPMAQLTEQYMQYVELIRANNLELAAVYLVMSATLMQIKSRLMLPVAPLGVEDEAQDPRAELMRRILAYEQIKMAAQQLERLPRAERDFWRAAVFRDIEQEATPPALCAQDIAEAWLDVVGQVKLKSNHRITRQELSIREHMSAVMKKLCEQPFLSFEELFEKKRDKETITVYYLALLELAKERLVMLTQALPYAALYVTLPEEPPLVAWKDGEAGALFDSPVLTEIEVNYQSDGLQSVLPLVIRKA